MSRLYSAWRTEVGGVFHGDPFSPPGILFERFSKDNISNVFGRSVPNSVRNGHGKNGGKGCLERVANRGQ